MSGLKPGTYLRAKCKSKREQQIPFGNDRKKSKPNGNSKANAGISPLRMIGSHHASVEMTGCCGGSNRRDDALLWWFSVTLVWRWASRYTLVRESGPFDKLRVRNDSQNGKCKRRGKCQYQYSGPSLRSRMTAKNELRQWQEQGQVQGPMQGSLRCA